MSHYFLMCIACNKTFIGRINIYAHRFRNCPELLDEQMDSEFARTIIKNLVIVSYSFM